ncbi:MAG: phospholipid carrier-dependent glycosyltransferase [Chloroflexota bacterium]
MVAMNGRWWMLVDGVLLVVLAAYALAGVPRTPFHGDEGMQVYMTKDFFTAFVDNNPADLPTNPPYTIDSDPHLRLINGTLQRYAAGAVLYARGHNTGDLPIPPGWNWGLSYEDNVAGSWLPKNSVLHPSRYTSATFFALSLPVMFALGWQFGGRLAAYVAVLVYGLNPTTLLNVRRATMEGSMLLFGLLAVLMGVVIARRVASQTRPAWYWWVLLALSGGLALAAKHSSAVFLIAAWGMPFVAVLLTHARQQHLRQLAAYTGALFVSGMAAIVLFVVLSPALWSAPIARLGNLAEERTKLLNIQVQIANGATGPGYRVAGLAVQPFIAPTQYFEFDSWGEVDAIVAQIDSYEGAWLGGLRAGYLIGVPLILLAAVGLVTARERYLLLWPLVTCALLLANPLAWQRYYLPLVPVWALYAGIGTQFVWIWICKRIRTQSSVAAAGVVSQTD